jgi:amino acid permease
MGMAGYLCFYKDTADNILLNFDLDVTIIYIGRIGYGITIMFGMPLVFLPCRAAILSIPEQLQERMQIIHQGDGEKLHTAMQGTKHHVANAVTFDEETPLCIERKKATQQSLSSDASSSSTSSSLMMADDITTKNVTPVISVESLPRVDPALAHEATRDQRVHTICTFVLLVTTYLTAIGVPGVGVVWSIAGSSMAMIIGFVIPAACYLTIRSKKNVNPRSVGALILLVFSVTASIVCTTHTIRKYLA